MDRTHGSYPDKKGSFPIVCIPRTRRGKLRDFEDGTLSVFRQAWEGRKDIPDAHMVSFSEGDLLDKMDSRK